jgi:hypothetical protein
MLLNNKGKYKDKFFISSKPKLNKDVRAVQPSFLALQ